MSTPGEPGLDPTAAAALVERLLHGRANEADLARLRAPVGPLSAEVLLAAATPLRPRSLAAGALPNRTVLDIGVAGPHDEGRLDVTVGAALLVAACDGTIAQHGWAPSRNGGRALVEALGLPVHDTARAAQKALAQSGYAWLPPDRASLNAAVATLLPSSPLLGLLGPLLNPAGPRCHIVGVTDPAHTEPLARALGLSGAEGALVVCSAGRAALGIDADTVGHRWSEGRITSFHHPGAGKAADGLESAGATIDAARLESTFDGLRGPLAESLALHAGAALWIAGLLPTFAEARRWARSRLSQKVDLTDFCGPAPATSPTRTDPSPAATSRRSPHPPRGGTRRSRDRRE